MVRSTTLTKPIRWGESMSDFVLPTGTVTLLLADIEGSVRLWESRGPEMTKAIAKHDVLVSELIGKHGGVRPKDQGEGDSFVAAFARPSQAVACALALQLAMTKEDWGGADIRVRIALHTGEVELRNEANYLGSTINRTARLRALAHGGQTLISASTYDLVADRLPEGASMKELGVHRLRDLSRPEHVFQLNHSELPDNFPPLRSLEALPNNLPIQLTSFVGREKEIEEINSLLQDNRMVTLTGSGGAGKTRLALHVAADLIEEFEGGLWLADLAPLRDPTFVAQAVASALGLPEEKDRDALATLIEHLKSRRALIVFDNCEHLVNECASLADSLLHSCPTVTIIATSREPLGVDGETAWRVPSLSVPDQTGPMLVDALTQYEAVRLFIDRATKSRHNFRITNENAPAVAQICHRLDGIPLAIELAAARVRVLSPEQISEGLADRFHLLTGGARTAMPRQQTLQASVEWSYELLSEKERLLLQRLSVFSGGFTLDAAEGVISGERIGKAEVLDLLTQLVDKSLVLVDDVTSGALRYHLLETIRQYSMERLVETGAVAEVRTHHMNYFHEFGESFQWPADAAGAARARMEIGLEVDNARTAARWAMTNAEPELKLRLATNTSDLLTMRGHRREALALIDEALAASEGASPLARSRALVLKGWIIMWLDPSTLYAVAEEALELAEQAGDSKTAANARGLMAQGAFALGDPEKVESVDQRMREAIEAGSDEEFVALSYRASNLAIQGDFVEAAELYGTAAELARASSNRIWLHVLLAHQAGNLVFLGAFERAEEIALSAVEVLADDERPSPMAVWALAGLAIIRGDFDRAREHFEGVLEEGRATETVAFEGGALLILGYLEAMLGNPAEALQKVREGTGLIDQIDGWRNAAFGTGLGIFSDAFRAAGDLSAGRDRLGVIREHNPSKLAVVLATLNESKIDRDEGRAEEAESLAFEALPALREFGSPMWLVDALELLGGLAAGQEGYEEAARLFAAAQSERDRIGYVRFPVEQPGYDSDVDKAHLGLGATFDEIWKAGSDLSLGEAVDYAMRGRGERKRPTAGWSSLTPAELRVSDLVAEGLSNPRIAERLFISRHTVETHLKNIFAKLGFTSRTQLASEATRRR